MRIIDDPEAWARTIEAEGDAELTRWPGYNEDIAKRRRDARYRNAARIRAAGPHRSWYAHYHSAEEAQAAAKRLRSRPEPGLRHEVAEITNAAICPHCQRPVIQADGRAGCAVGAVGGAADLRSAGADEATESSQSLTAL